MAQLDSSNIYGTLKVTHDITANTLISTQTAGTAPLTIVSTTLVTNLNADLLDGKHASDFSLTSHTHSYDNYTNWLLKINTDAGQPITSGSIVDLKAGTKIALSRVGNAVTLSHAAIATTGTSGSGRIYLQGITTDGYGHLTGFTTAEETVTGGSMVPSSGRTTLNSAVTTIALPFVDYRKATDSLLVFENSTFINLNQEYTIGGDNMSIVKVGGGTWASGTVFDFILTRFVCPNDVVHDAISITCLDSYYEAVADNVTHILINNAQYNPDTDMLKVFYNGETRLAEGLHYTKNVDNISIDLVGWSINTNDRIYFETWKKIRVLADGVVSNSGVFNSTTGRTITHNLNSINYAVTIQPTSNPSGTLGEFWVENKTLTTFVVKNSGVNTTATFDWIITRR